MHVYFVFQVNIKYMIVMMRIIAVIPVICAVSSGYIESTLPCLNFLSHQSS
jgi:hypothetical protein